MSVLRRLAAAVLVPRPAPPALQGGVPFDQLYPPGAGSLGTLTRRPGSSRTIAAATASQILALANPDRTMLTIYNDSSAVLYVLHGPVGASSDRNTLELAAGATYIIETPDPYTGDVSGAWAAATGQAMVTETTGGQ